MKVLRSSKRQNRREQERRQLQAKERQTAYDKLSPQEKLVKLNKFRAKRQRARLEVEIGKK